MKLNWQRWVVLGLLCLGGVLLPTSAQAAPGDSITQFTSDVVIDASGNLKITEKITYSFGGSGRHGIYRDLVTGLRYDPNETGNDQIRVYPVSNIEVSSPSGASAETDINQTDLMTHIRIGDPDRTVSGTEVYILSYEVAGAFNRFTEPTNGLAPHDELYWNILGSQWQATIENAEITVTAPQGASQAKCFQGELNSTEACRATAGIKSTFSVSSVSPGEGATILLAYPLNMVSQTEPILKDAPKQGLARLTQISPVAGVGSVGVALAGLGGMALLTRRRGRDAQYLGLTPGLNPVAGQVETEQLVRLKESHAAVQFTPPTGLHPGQIGTLIDEVAHPADVTATIVDLAVRGYLRIEEVPDERNDWRLVQLTPPAGQQELRPYEQRLLEGIFHGRTSASLQTDLKETFAGDMAVTRDILYREVTELGWFRGNPKHVREKYRFLGFAVAGLAIAGLVFGGAVWQSINTLAVSLGLLVAGLGIAALAGRMPARTAAGTAVLVQAWGFKKYLVTAEAQQIKFEEGQDIFSKYLPYAMIFGVADRWAKVFEQLAASGLPVIAPTWYVGHSPNWSYYALGSAINSFQSSAGTALTSTPAASGSSGFGGGGGFSGGGGGGGGGGSW